MSLKESLVRIPLIGYGLQVLHHVVNLPVICRDLLAEVRHVGELDALHGQGLQRTAIGLAQATATTEALRADLRNQAAKLAQLQNSYAATQAHSTESLRARIETVAAGMTIVSDAILELKGQSAGLSEELQAQANALDHLRQQMASLADQLTGPVQK